MGLSEKVRFEIAVSDDFVQATVDALREGARTGEGAVLVIPEDGDAIELPVADPA